MVLRMPLGVEHVVEESVRIDIGIFISPSARVLSECSSFSALTSFSFVYDGLKDDEHNFYVNANKNTKGLN